MNVTQQSGCPEFHSFHLLVGAVSGLLGPAWSPLFWKSRCWAADFGSTWPCCGFAPSRFSGVLGAVLLPTLEEVVPDAVVEEPAGAGADDDGLSVFGDGGLFVLRSQPAAKASETAATKASNLMCAPKE